jgi:hypothetical protein
MFLDLQIFPLPFAALVAVVPVPCRDPWMTT